MTQEAQIAVWGALSALPLILNASANRSADAVGVSALVFLGWCLERVLWASYGPPGCTHLYPLLDAVLGTAIFASWWTDRHMWKLGIVALLLAQCVAQLAYIIAEPAPGSFLRYLTANNALYSLELIFAGTPGGKHVVGSALHRLHPLARPSAHMGL